jgi:hypothetical protein
MLRILILANLFYLSVIAGGISHTLDSSGGIIAEPSRVKLLNSERNDAAAVLFSDKFAKRKPSPKTSPQLGNIAYDYMYEELISGPFGPHGPDVKFRLSHNQGVYHRIYDISGSCIFGVITPLEMGWHTFVFTGIDKNGFPLPKGLYFYRLFCEDTTIVLKIRQW